MANGTTRKQAKQIARFLKGRRGKRIMIGTGIALGAYFLLRGALSIAINIQDEIIKVLEKSVDDLKSSYNVMSFKIIKKQLGKQFIAYRFRDLDGNQVGDINNIILPGTGVNFDFLQLQIKDKFYTFPWRVFSDGQAPKDAKVIFDQYDNNGFPEIYNSSTLDNKTRKALTKAFKLIKAENTEDLKVFGSAVGDIEGAEFDIGTQYNIFSLSKGGMEIIEQ